MNQTISGREKSLVLLSILGPQKASRILRRLPEQLSNLLASEVAKRPPVSPKDVEVIFKELTNNVLQAAPEYMSLSAPDEAVNKQDGSVENNNGFNSTASIDLENMEPKERYLLISPKKMVDSIKNEPQRIQNFVLSQLPENKVKEVLAIINLEKKIKLKHTDIEKLPIQESMIEVLFKHLLKKIEANGRDT